MQSSISGNIANLIATSTKNVAKQVLVHSGLKIKSPLKKDVFQKEAKEKKEKSSIKNKPDLKLSKYGTKPVQKDLTENSFLNSNHVTLEYNSQEILFEGNKEIENDGQIERTKSIELPPITDTDMQNEEFQNYGQIERTESIELPPITDTDMQNEEFQNYGQIERTESIELPPITDTDMQNEEFQNYNRLNTIDEFYPQIMYESYTALANIDFSDDPIQDFNKLAQLCYIPNLIQPNLSQYDINAIKNKVSKLIKTDKTYTFDEYGEKVVYCRLENSPEEESIGSNGGFWLYNDQKHKLLWVKQCGEQSKAEVVASKLYAEAKIPSAVMKLAYLDGKESVLSQFIPNLEHIDMQNIEQKKELYDGFGMDVLLANWDAVISNNAQVSSNCTYRIDFGGCFNFRAQAINGLSPLKFTCFPHAIQTLINPEYNEESSEAYSGMTYNDLAYSLQRVVNINDSTICNLLDSENMCYLKPITLKRKKFLNLILNEIKNKQYNNKLVDVDSINMIISDVLYSSIKNAETLEELHDIDNALYNIDDKTDKEYLLNSLAEKFESLKTQNLLFQSQSVSEEEVRAIVVNNNYGNSLEYINETEQLIINNYEEKAPELIALLKQKLTDDDIKLMTKVLNICNGKYIGIFTTDDKTFQDFIMFFKALNLFNDLQDNFDKINGSQWGAIVNTFVNRANIQEMKSICEYKLSSRDINDILTSKKNFSYKKEDSTIEEEEEHINNLTQFISKQIIPEDMTVYRGEDFGFLESIKLSSINGLVEELLTYNFIDNDEINKSLGELLKKFTLTNPYDFDYNINDVLSGYVLEAVQKRFLSTSLNNGFKEAIKWEIKVPAGTQAAYLESVNIPQDRNYDPLLSNGYKNYHHENELLVQRNSTILIENMYFAEYIEPMCDENDVPIYGYWRLQGKLMN